MTRDADIINEAIRCDAGVWFESGNAKIRPKDSRLGLITPRLNYLQNLVNQVVTRMEELDLPMRIIGLKPRQKGSTTFFSALDYHLIRRRTMSVCAIGGEYDQTLSFWKMMQTYQANDRFDWGNTGVVNEANGKWSNGSFLRKETANDKLAGVSDTFQALHCTEVARWARYGVSDAATVLTNIQKCVPILPGTLIVLESTAEGAAGTFYEKWLDGIDADKFLSGEVKAKIGDFIRVFAPWFEFGDSAFRLTPGDKEDIRRTIDKDPEYEGEQFLIDTYGKTGADGVLRLGTSVRDFDVYEQLAWRRWAIHNECDKDKDIFDRDYPHSWKTAFQKSGNQRFNKAGVAALRRKQGGRAPLYGLLEEAQDRMAFRQTEENESKFIIYEKPIVSKRYLLSIDPATGASQTAGEDPDEHSAFVLRAGFWASDGIWQPPGAVARILPCRWDIDILSDAAWALARYYGDRSGCIIMVEMNKDSGIVENLRAKGADLWMRSSFNQKEQTTTKQIGWLTTPKNRETWVEALARAIREWNTPGDGIEVWDDHALTQFENFVRKDNGWSEAGAGHHDDDISALGIGMVLLDHATTYFPNRGGEGLPPDLAGLVRAPGAAPSQFS